MKGFTLTRNLQGGLPMKQLIIILMVISLAGMSTACKTEQRPPQPSTKASQAQKAKAAADSIAFTENAEIDNIKNRLELTSDPGLTGFVLLMNEAGQPIMYTGVKGKITSGGKRLTRPYKVVGGWDCGQNYCDKDLPAPSDEGTWGHSNPYIYFWTTNGQYIQWNGKYLYSDKPFRTKIEPLVISVK